MTMAPLAARRLEEMVELGARVVSDRAHACRPGMRSSRPRARRRDVTAARAGARYRSVPRRGRRAARPRAARRADPPREDPALRWRTSTSISTCSRPPFVDAPCANGARRASPATSSSSPRHVPRSTSRTTTSRLGSRCSTAPGSTSPSSRCSRRSVSTCSAGRARGARAAWEEGVARARGRRRGDASRPRSRPAQAGLRGRAWAPTRLGDLDGLAPVLDALRAHGGFLFVHRVRAAPPRRPHPAWWRAVVVYTARCRPRTSPGWQAARSAGRTSRRLRDPRRRGPVQLERLASRGVDVRSLAPNVYFDTASYGRRALELCVETFGVEQLVYGSDPPVVDPNQHIRAIRGFGESVEKLITRDTPIGS